MILAGQKFHGLIDLYQNCYSFEGGCKQGFWTFTKMNFDLPDL